VFSLPYIDLVELLRAKLSSEIGDVGSEGLRRSEMGSSLER
jgi:hypothetical protein